IAVLPGQLGIAVYSPRLDAQGNTVRGIRVCEAVSRDLELHLFATPPPGKSAIRRKFTGLELKSTRSRSPEALRHLKELRPRFRIYQLQGSLGYPAAEVVVRDIMDHIGEMSALLLDFKRVLAMKASACRLLEKLFEVLFRKNVAIAIVNAGALPEMRLLETSLARNPDIKLRIFDDSDLALEWSEEQLLGSAESGVNKTDRIVVRSAYELFKGLTPEELLALEPCLTRKIYSKGSTIVQAGSEARELFFLGRGSVS